MGVVEGKRGGTGTAGEKEREGDGFGACGKAGAERARGGGGPHGFFWLGAAWVKSQAERPSGSEVN